MVNQAVFVQELLWFIIVDKIIPNLVGVYSYKNCYGLSFDELQDIIDVFEYSYKNCYGLSE